MYIPAPTTARDVLAIIDAFLTAGAEAGASVEAYTSRRQASEFVEAEKLWNVLTALRGPDFESDSIKHETTEPIRRAAFPMAAAAYDAEQYIPGGPMMRGSKYVPQPGSPYSHFEQHARLAALALELGF